MFKHDLEYRLYAIVSDLKEWIDLGMVYTRYWKKTSSGQRADLRPPQSKGIPLLAKRSLPYGRNLAIWLQVHEPDHSMTSARKNYDNGVMIKV